MNLGIAYRDCHHSVCVHRRVHVLNFNCSCLCFCSNYAMLCVILFLPSMSVLMPVALGGQQGDFHGLIEELKQHLSLFVHISLGQFEVLLAELAPHLRRQRTNFRALINLE